MNIINPIYHKYYNKLFDQVDHHKATIFLCMCLQYWKISKYKVTGDDNIWFTRSLDAMADEMSISKSSLSRYLNLLEEKGLIKRINKLGWDSHSKSVKKRLYIRVTDKLLSIVGHDQAESAIPVQPFIETARLPATSAKFVLTDNAQATDHVEKSVSEKLSTSVDMTSTSQAELFPTYFDNIENIKKEFSIYKGNYSNKNSNNTVRQRGIVNNFISTNKTTIKTPLEFPVEQALNEHLTPKLKNYIKGMLTNMQTQHGLKFSNPKQLFAEVVFSVLNKDNQLTGINDPHHRVNIIAKLLREKRWLTPKGFYNHWDIGAQFKQSQADNDARYQQQKQENMDSSSFMGTKQICASQYVKRDIEQQNAWREIMINITTEERYLNQMQQQHKKNPNQATESVINSTILKLAKFQEIKHQIEEKMTMKNAA